MAGESVAVGQSSAYLDPSEPEDGHRAENIWPMLKDVKKNSGIAVGMLLDPVNQYSPSSRF